MAVAQKQERHLLHRLYDEGMRIQVRRCQIRHGEGIVQRVCCLSPRETRMGTLNQRYLNQVPKAFNVSHRVPYLTYL